MQKTKSSFNLIIRSLKIKQGFTLIELMVVIAIIGILVVIVITALDPVRLIGQARDSRRRSDLNQIKAAMQLYYNDYKAYPNTATSIPFGSAWTVSGTTYMKQIPKDPANVNYGYTAYDSTGANCTGASVCTDYSLGTALQYPSSTDDPNTITKCSSGTGITVPTNGVGTVATFEVCND